MNLHHSVYAVGFRSDILGYKVADTCRFSNAMKRLADNKSTLSMSLAAVVYVRCVLCPAADLPGRVGTEAKAFAARRISAISTRHS